MDRQKTFRTVVKGAFIIALFAIYVPSAFADGVIRDGMGAISIGRGGTNLAFSDNGAIILDNPAGMSWVGCCGLAEFSVDTLLTDLHYTDPQNNVDGEVKPYPMGHFAIMQRLADERFVAGFGVFTPAGFGAEYDMTHPVLGTTRQKSFATVVKALPSLAFQASDRLSIGGGVGVAASHAELEGPFHLQTGMFAGTPTLLDVQATGATITWNLGLQYKITEWTTFGISYTSKTDFKLDGNASAFVPGLGTSRMEADVEMVWPQSVGAGIAYAPFDGTKLSAEAIWYDWSDAFDNINMTFSGFTNPLFTGALGAVVNERLPLAWKDSISIRTGLEHAISLNRIVRLGYVYHHEAIPNSTLTPYIAASLEHAVSAGYGIKTGQGEINLAYQYSWGRTRFVGQSAVLGGDFDNSTLDAGVHFFAFSFLRRF